MRPDLETWPMFCRVLDLASTTVCREQQEDDEVEADPHTDFPLPGTGGGSGGGGN